MKLNQITDFLLAGVAVVPALLLYAGFPSLAILNLMPLLFAGCLFGMAEQFEEESEKKTDD